MTFSEFAHVISRPATAVAFVLCQWPMAAAACPHCYGSSDTRVLNTYYFSTAMLSLLPFAVIGTIAAVGWYAGRQVRLRAERRNTKPGGGRP